MKWFFYFVFAAAISATAVAVLSQGWNLPAPASAGKPAASLVVASNNDDSLPACCAKVKSIQK
jgi:hypothetical protein